MDILYPIKKTTLNEELRYSLRSLVNIPHNKVFIVGDCPDFINEENVFYIPNTKEESRYKTTTNHIKIACQCKELSEDFILMNDDFFILNPITEEDLNLNRGYIINIFAYYIAHHRPLTHYDQLVIQSMNELKKMGFEKPISFELHTPIIINKTNFLSIVNKLNNDSLHCCKRSVYGNHFIKYSKTIEDVKVLSNHIFKPEDYTNLMSCSEVCWTKIKSFIQKKFPNKSIYEK